MLSSRRRNIETQLRCSALSASISVTVSLYFCCRHFDVTTCSFYFSQILGQLANNSYIPLSIEEQNNYFIKCMFLKFIILNN